jgi:hypothetical protein
MTSCKRITYGESWSGIGIRDRDWDRRGEEFKTHHESQGGYSGFMSALSGPRPAIARQKTRDKPPEHAPLEVGPI